MMLGLMIAELVFASVILVLGAAAVICNTKTVDKHKDRDYN